MHRMRCLLSLLILLAAVSADEFRMIARPPPAILAAPDWKSGIDLAAKRKKPLFLYFTANW